MSDTTGTTVELSAAEIAANAEELIAQFDRESNTRRFTGIPDLLTRGLLLLFAVYVLWVTLFAALPEQVRRTAFLGILVFTGYIFYPVKKSMTRKVNHVAWYDFVCAILGSGSFFYYSVNFTAIVNRAVNLTPLDIAVGVLGVLLLAELCRRVVGMPILVVAALFLTYAFSDGYSLKRVIHQLFYTTDGIIGTPIGVCSTFIVLFIFLASFLEKSGIGAFFIDLANSVAGWASGGPAKVAVISSALEGLYSGSSVANTVGSGSVTIPMMKKTGYTPEFAAAVEASASTGGQIIPPIMGAAAFLMAEFTGIPYIQIAIAAILPASLYFVCIFFNVHFEAKRLGLRGLPKESIPKFGKLFIRQGYLLLPVVVLVVLMDKGFTPAYAACLAIAAAIIVAMIRKENRFTPKTFTEAVCSGARNTIGVGLACAMAGIVVGIVTLTGLGQVLITGLVAIAGKSLMIALLLTMVSCIVLGMGIPTTANYVIMATITAPIVMRMEIAPGVLVPILAAHMFVFYFGIVADITPPVALAAYAGSAIAKSNPMKTAIIATRLALAAFIVPFVFVYNPEMLFTAGITSSALNIFLIVITSVIGMFGVSAAVSGFMFRHMHPLQRLLAVGAGLLLIKPGIATDLIGLAIIAGIVVIQKVGQKKPLLHIFPH
jgi:TRAP transporter 4TM/12TM fusion protein